MSHLQPRQGAEDHRGAGQPPHQTSLLWQAGVHHPGSPVRPGDRDRPREDLLADQPWPPVFLLAVRSLQSPGQAVAAARLKRQTDAKTTV